MIELPFSITLLGITSALILLGLGQRVLDRMRMTTQTAVFLLVLMIFSHFLPVITLSSHASIDLGALIPLGVVVYLLVTTSSNEAWRAITVSVLTTAIVLLTDKLLPVEPGTWYIIDPVAIGGISAGIFSYMISRSRRSAFIGGILGVFLADLWAMIQLYLEGIPQDIVIGSGGVFSSMTISPIIAVLIAEGIGEIRERIHKGPALIRRDGDDIE